MKCKNCGYVSDENGKFCPACGSPIGNEFVSEKGVIGKKDTNLDGNGALKEAKCEMADTGMVDEKIEPPKTGKKKRPLFRVVVVIVFIFVVGILVSGKKSSDLSETDVSDLNDYSESSVAELVPSNKMVEEENQDSLHDNELSEGRNFDEYILPNSDSEYLIESDLAGLDNDMLRLGRNEIYARHGRRFQAEDLNEYFNSKPWYNGYLSAEEFDDSVFNEYEKANLALIKSLESGESAKIEKNLCGMYQMLFGSEGEAGLEIVYGTGDDTYYVIFSGNYYVDRGYTEGFLSAYTDGTDGIWDYYDSDTYECSYRLIYDGQDTITVTSLRENTYGGIGFPGFAGDYVRLEEYPMS